MNRNEFEDVHSRLHRLGEEISRGGQGAVYRTENPDVALKLELHNDEALMDASGNVKYQRLRALPVPPGLHITMPGAALKNAGGYVMTLLSDMIPFESAFLPPKLTDMPRNPWIEETFSEEEALGKAYLLYYATGGLRRRLEAYRKAAEIVSELHENGLVYCDFSHNNLFVSSLPDGAEKMLDRTEKTSDDAEKTPDGGRAQTPDDEAPEVWLIDADNLNFRRNIISGVCTPTYCAPEVALHGKFSSASDCFAFAVMLFETLSMTHPFKGEQYENDDDWTSEKSGEERIDEGELPWILDTENQENAKGTEIAVENCVSKNLMALFDRTFCDSGKTRPNTRPSMMEWAEELARCVDLTAVCPKCGMGFDAGQFDVCPWCDAEFPVLETDCFFTDGEEKGQRVWSVCHECGLGRVWSIPRRAVTGFAGEDESAFTAQWTEEALVLGNLTQSLRFECRERETWVPVSGSIRKRGELLTLRVTDPQDGTRNIVEVRVRR